MPGAPVGLVWQAQQSLCPQHGPDLLHEGYLQKDRQLNHLAGAMQNTHL